MTLEPTDEVTTRWLVSYPADDGRPCDIAHSRTSVAWYMDHGGVSVTRQTTVRRVNGNKEWITRSDEL